MTGGHSNIDASRVAVPDVTIERLDKDKKSLVDSSAIMIGKSFEVKSKYFSISGVNFL